MIVLNPRVPVEMASTTLFGSYLLACTSPTSLNEYMCQPTKDQSEGLKISADYINRINGGLANTMRDSGLRSQIIKKAMSSKFTMSDYDASRDKPLKGYGWKQSFSDWCNLSERDLSETAEASDYVETASGADKRGSEIYAKAQTIRLEDIDPTWVVKYITSHIFNMLKPNDNNRVFKHKVPARKAVYDENGEQVQQYILYGCNADEEERREPTEQEDLRELAIACKFLYDASYRPSINIDLLAAAAYLVGRYSGDIKEPSNVDFLTLYVRVWNVKQRTFGHGYAHSDLFEKCPGIQLLRDRTTGNMSKTFSTDIEQAFSTVMRIVSKYDITMYNGGRFTLPDHTNFYLYYESFRNRRLPRLMRESLVTNDDHKEEMFHLLKDMYKGESAGTTRVSADMQESSIASIFEMYRPLLEVHDDPDKTLLDYSLSNTQIYGIVSKWTRDFLPNMGLMCRNMDASAFYFDNDLLYVKTKFGHMPLPLSLWYAAYCVVEGGFLVPYTFGADIAKGVAYVIPISFMEEFGTAEAKPLMLFVEVPNDV